jgi:hypothetical protein
MKLFLIICSALILSSCGLIKEKPPVEKLVYVTTPLPLPSRPILPTWSGSDMQCLSDETKVKVRNRDLFRKQYAEMLEEIIKTTHNSK